MEYEVVKPLPQGQQPGDRINIDNDEHARTLLLVDAIKPLPTLKTPPRGRFRRADLEPEKRTELKAERTEDLTADE